MFMSRRGHEGPPRPADLVRPLIACDASTRTHRLRGETDRRAVRDRLPSDTQAFDNLR